MSQITLILGGARSGKSRLGEELALSSGLSPYYIATAEASDAEMVDRISNHQKSRSELWSLIEEPLNLCEIIKDQSAPDRILFVDCLTLWLSNNLLKGNDLAQLRDKLCQNIKNTSGPTILISNEVGGGIVPENYLGRHFRDEAGWLNQDVAEIADDVYYAVAGLTIPLKKNGRQIHNIFN